MILDPRLLSKGYGRFFLSSLPPAPLITGTWQQLREQLRTFYADDSRAGPQGLTPREPPITVQVDA